MSQPCSTLGYHYFPDEDHFTQADLERWLPILQSLGASWLTLRAGSERAIPESFLQEVLTAGIQPIVHLACPLDVVEARSLETLLDCYGKWGVHYVVVGDRPNLRSRWTERSWGQTALVERCLDRLIPILLRMRDSGLRPALPPLEPGGDYWDTAFLEATLQALVRRGHSDLVNSLTLTAYAWTYGKALDWGSGGPSRWSEAVPYHTPTGYQDQRGLRIFDWYVEIARSVTGRALPVLAIAGGSLRSHAAEGRADVGAVEENLGIARLLIHGQAAAHLEAFCFYLLSADPGHPDFDEAWFSSPDLPRPTAERVSRLVEQEAKHSGSPHLKPIEHYVLLPEQAELTEPSLWTALARLLSVGQATLGTSPQEARFAERVTLVGDDDTFSAALADELIDAGCSVERMTLPTAEPLHFDAELPRAALVAATRFPSGDRNE